MHVHHVIFVITCSLLAGCTSIESAIRCCTGTSAMPQAPHAEPPIAPSLRPAPSTDIHELLPPETTTPVPDMIDMVQALTTQVQSAEATMTQQGQVIDAFTEALSECSTERPTAEEFEAKEQELRVVLEQLASTQQRAETAEHQLKEQIALQEALAAAHQEIDSLKQRMADQSSTLSRLHQEHSDQGARLLAGEHELLAALRPHVEQGHIQINMDQHRLLVTLASQALFPSANDLMTSEGIEVLKMIGTILKDFPSAMVTVDGHTDAQPVHPRLQSQFPTNQALSEARANNAAKILIEQGVTQVTTQGHADRRPVDTNATEAGRAHNRRIEILVTR